MSAFVERHLVLILRIAGYATASMLLVAVAPNFALAVMFGQAPAGALEETIARNWGFLIGLGGLSLIYASYVPGARRLAMMIAVSSKAVYITLFLTVGRAHLGDALVAVLFDALVVLVFLVYLLSTPSEFPGRGAGRDGD